MLPCSCRRSVFGLGVRRLTTSGIKAAGNYSKKRRASSPVRQRQPPAPPTPAKKWNEGVKHSRDPERRPPVELIAEQPTAKGISTSLQEAAQNNSHGLLAPVHIPEDPHAILPPNHPALHILDNSSIVIHRQIEMMNLIVGFEQANRYVINDAQGNLIGFLAEQEHGLGNAVARQTFRTHRSFTTHVFDRNEKEVLRFHRPFSYISSRIRVYDALSAADPTYKSSDALSGTSMGSISSGTGAQTAAVPVSELRVIGEAQQQWAPLRRKYNLFLHRPLDQDPSNQDAPQLTSGDLPLSKSTALQVAGDSSENIGFRQFASVDEPFLSWDFSLKSEDGRLIGSVNRNFAGFGREIFTDTGVYALRMDSASLAAEPQHLISQTGQENPEDLNEEQQKARGMTLDQRAVMLATAVSVDFDYFSRKRQGAFGGMMPLWLPFPGESLPPADGSAGAAGEAGAAGAEGGAAGAGIDDASPQSGSDFDAPMDDPYSSPGQSGGDDSWGGFGGRANGDGSSGRGGGGSGNAGGGGSSADAGGDGGGGNGGGGWGMGDFFDDL